MVVIKKRVSLYQQTNKELTKTNKMEYNRETAVNAIARLTKRHNAKKDVEFKSFSEKRREERERIKKELKNK